MSEFTGTTSPVNDTRNQPWPDNVIARYETTVGGIVELIDSDHSIQGSCTGCPDHAQPWPFSYDPTCSGYRMDDYVKSQASSWAQRHATECRALPRPA